MKKLEEKFQMGWGPRTEGDIPIIINRTPITISLDKKTGKAIVTRNDK